jgi:hypothetical protein
MPPIPRTLLAILVTLPMSLPAADARAQIVVVSGAQGPIRELTREQAEQLYLGRVGSLAGGMPVSLADLPAGALRDRFYERLTGKNPSQIRAHWSRMVFTGRALPPREVASAAELRSLLVAEPQLVGYLAAADADAGVRILLQIP